MESELPKRKSLRLPKYDYSQAGYYFVTVCAKDQRCIFGTVVGGDAHIAPRTELSQIGDTVEKHIKTIPGINKYCIMPNHIHMIIAIEHVKNGPMWASAPTQTLFQRIRSFKILVSKEVGIPVFQRSFYDHIIRNEADHQRIWQYIDDNPA